VKARARVRASVRTERGVRGGDAGERLYTLRL